MKNNIKLSSTLTISRYRELEKKRDRKSIADFILKRFTERYIQPLKAPPKHGFCIMAVCCLMIEALESFWKGWSDTNGRSKEAFLCFFERCKKLNSGLGVFSEVAEDFYVGVRCGILHQAETTRGWRIWRKGSLYCSNEKIINAKKFLRELENVLKAYCEELRNSDWNDKIWENLRKKMDAVIKNCEPQAS